MPLKTLPIAKDIAGHTRRAEELAKMASKRNDDQETRLAALSLRQLPVFFERKGDLVTAGIYASKAFELGLRKPDQLTDPTKVQIVQLVAKGDFKAAGIRALQMYEQGQISPKELTGAIAAGIVQNEIAQRGGFEKIGPNDKLFTAGGVLPGITAAPLIKARTPQKTYPPVVYDSFHLDNGDLPFAISVVQEQLFTVARKGNLDAQKLFQPMFDRVEVRKTARAKRQEKREDVPSKPTRDRESYQTFGHRFGTCGNEFASDQIIH